MGKGEAKEYPGPRRQVAKSEYGNGRNKSIRRDETRSSPKNDVSCEMT